MQWLAVGDYRSLKFDNGHPSTFNIILIGVKQTPKIYRNQMVFTNVFYNILSSMTPKHVQYDSNWCQKGWLKTTKAPLQ